MKTLTRMFFATAITVAGMGVGLAHADEMGKSDNTNHGDMMKDDGMKHDDMKKDDGMKKDTMMKDDMDKS